VAKDLKAMQFQAPIMSAFRHAFEAHDARRREIKTIKGERVIAGRQSQGRGDEAALKRDLSIDLVALLNTTDLGSVEDPSDFPYVRQSIINFGLYDVAHLVSEEVGVDAIADDLAASLKEFEPRLDTETLTIERSETDDDVNQRVRFSVSAEMFCTPANLPVDFVAEVEIGSGKVQLSRLPT
jgi:type VI secretion system protein ImpF